jgi:hypothetical protein
MRPFSFKSVLFFVVCWLCVVPAMLAQDFSIQSITPPRAAMASGDTTVNLALVVTNQMGQSAGNNDIFFSLDGGAFFPPPASNFIFNLPDSTAANPDVVPLVIPKALLTTARTFTVSVLIQFFGTGVLTATHSTSFTVYGPPTAITISPTSVPPGSGVFTLNVTGTGIQPGATVYWDDGSGNPAQALATHDTASGVAAVVPTKLVATAGTALVSVQNPNLPTASPTVPFYIAAAPTLTPGGLSPSSAVPGGPDFAMTVNGGNFVPTSVVTWNSSALTTTYVSATQLTAAVSAALIKTAGSATVQVANPGGLTSNSLTFTIAPLQVPAINPGNGLTPSSATAGTLSVPLSITGSGFLSGATLQWVSATTQTLSTTFIDAGHLATTIPGTLLATPGVASVSVTNPNGTTSNTVSFTVGSVPAISASGGLLPSTVAAGTASLQLAVTGANFVSGSVVLWDDGTGPSATNPHSLTTQFISTTQLSAAVPGSLLLTAGTAAVTVQNPGNALSNAAIFTIGTPVTINAAGLTPSSAIAGGPTINLKVTGTNFKQGAVVQWDGGAGPQVLSTGLVDAQTLTSIVPATLVAAPGAALISVKNPDGTQSASAVFRIQAPAPVISATGGLVPATIPTGSPTMQVTVNGANFTSGSVVQWNTGAVNQALATGFTGPGQLTAIIPATNLTTAVIAIVTVMNPDGSTSNPVLFTVGNAPSIAPGSLNPPSVLAGGPSFNLNVTGANFQQGAQVHWSSAAGSQVLSTGFVSATQLSAVVPPTLTATVGSALVTVVNPDGVVSNAEPFAVVANVSTPPVILTLLPSHTSAGSGAFTITVTGSGFTSGSIVGWNSGTSTTNLATGVDTSTGVPQLTALVPPALVANPGVALITVSNPGNVVSNTLTFTIDAAGSASLPNITDPGGLNTSSVTAGSAAFTLIVSGTNFTNTSVVQWNNGSSVQLLSTGYVTDPTTNKVTALRAIVPASLIANVGVALITVANPGNAVSNAVKFDITAGVPLLNGFSDPNVSPVAGSASFQLGVVGSGFVSGSVVRWDNGAGPQNLTTGFLTSSSLTALVPAALIAAPGTAFITVSNPGGIVSNTLSITIKPPANNQPPSVTGLDPTSISANSASFKLTITGTGFVTGALANWNAGGNTQVLTTGFTSGTQLIALVPAGLLATPGPVFISVSNPGGAISNTMVFTINPQSGSAPTINTSNGLVPPSVTIGSTGFQLQVNGSNFQNGSVVQFNLGSGPQALQTGYVSGSQLNALVPASLLTTPGIAFITVLNPGGSTSNAVTFGVGGAVAVISALAPASAPAGTSGLQVTITGSNFTTGSAANWGGTTIPATVTSPTQLSVVVPASLLASPGQTVVTVQNPSGTSNAVTFTVSPPTLTGISPTTAIAGSAAFTLTVTGTNFVAGSSVVWSGTNLPTTLVTPAQLTAQVSAALLATAGPVNVLVANPGGATTTALSFIVTPPNAPTVTGLNPASAVAGGSSFQLTVAGTGFVSGAQVLWNGAALPTTVASSTQVTALVDSTLIALPQTATVVVQNPGSPLSAAQRFVINGPTITSITPNTVSAGAPGFTLAVAGANFLPGSAVVWNGISLPTAVGSATQLSAPVPAAYVASSGSVSVTVQNPGGAISTAATFTIGPFTLAIATASLPDAIVGSQYTQILSATGGSPPYTWSVSGGALPAGLALDPNSGTLSGTPTAASTATVGFTATDSVQRTISKTFVLRTTLPIGITTTSPLPTILSNASPYTFSLQASGGTPPYTWSVAGALPPGFSLGSSSGQISGIPNTAGSYQFSITLVDSRQQSTTSIFSWLILPQPQSLSISGLTNPTQPAQQPGISVSLANPYPVDITGTLSLTFVSAVGVDDTNVQFSTGGRQVQFTIKAGDTAASIFQQPPAAGQTTPTTPASPPQTSLSLVTGTTAGNITLSAKAAASGSDITPSPAPVLTAQVPKLAPVITHLTMTAITGGVNISVSGYSTTREVQQGALQFTAAQGTELNNSTVTVPLASLFSTWYQNSASVAFGSQFTVAIPISVQGATSVISSVTVTLTNGVATSAPVTASLQ